MLRRFACVELAASVVLLGLAAWPFSGACSGRFLGLDCESRAIFAVNLLGPLGILALACSTWCLITDSARPQYVLLLGAGAVIGYVLVHLA